MQLLISVLNKEVSLAAIMEAIKKKQIPVMIEEDIELLLSQLDKCNRELKKGHKYSLLEAVYKLGYQTALINNERLFDTNRRMKGSLKKKRGMDFLNKDRKKEGKNAARDYLDDYKKYRCSYKSDHDFFLFLVKGKENGGTTDKYRNAIKRYFKEEFDKFKKEKGIK